MLNAEIGIDQDGALHQGVNSVHQCGIGARAILPLQPRYGLFDCQSVIAEHLCKILFDCIPQRMIWKHHCLCQLGARDWRCVVALEPLLDVSALICVTICEDDWIMHALAGDGTIE